MKLQKIIASSLLMSALSVGLAQSGGTYDITRSTLDGGGGRSTGGSFAVSGTTGQPDAGLVMSGGSFNLSGGFWPAPAPSQLPDALFQDGFESP